MATKLKPLGEHAYPAFQLYCAAEDHLEAAKSMTVLSRELLLVVNDVAAKVAEKPRIMSVMFGYAARLSAGPDVRPGGRAARPGCGRSGR